ncbi:DUF5752 family protein [Candidatus Bathyarchaeota archaeon]|nr:DUF5752 family protein [Candidatus Bathyarchaeota archaeon]
MDRKMILTILNGLTNPVTINELAHEAKLTRGKTLGSLSGLVRDGFVNEKEKKYSLATKGRRALKELNPLSGEGEFRFYLGIDQYSGISAKSLHEFRDCLKTIDVRSVEFHTVRGDFEAWVRNVFDDHSLAQEFAYLKEAGLRGEDLRTRLSEVVEKRYKEFYKLVT